MPPLPPEPAPEPEPGPPVKGPRGAPSPPDEAPPRRARPRPWEYALGAGVGWDSNIDFVVPDGPSGTAVVPRGGLARVFWGPRGQLRATGAGHWTGYPGQDELHRYYADFGLDGDYHASPGTEWRANASYGFGYSDSSRILVEQGVLLPAGEDAVLHRARSALTAADGGAARPCASTGATTAPSSTRRTLIDGDSARGTIGLERQLEPAEHGRDRVRARRRAVGPERPVLPHALRLPAVDAHPLPAQRPPPRGRRQLHARRRPRRPRAGGELLRRGQLQSAGETLEPHALPPPRGHPRFRDRREPPGASGGAARDHPDGAAWELALSATHVRPDVTASGEPVYGSSDDAFASSAAAWAGGSRSRARRGIAGAAPPARFPEIEAFQAGLFLTLLSPGGRAVLPGPGR